MPAITNTLEPIPVVASKAKCQALTNASGADTQALVDIHELLDHLFVRNRHQHRRDYWFKSLQQFRKQLSLLLNELGAETKKSATAEKLSIRLQFWDEKCVHQWYLHFTQLVASGVFAVLGLVLMACVARVCRIVGITALYEEIASEDMKMVFSMMDEGIVESEFGGQLEGNDAEEDEDWGEVMPREEAE